MQAWNHRARLKAAFKDRIEKSREQHRALERLIKGVCLVRIKKQTFLDFRDLLIEHFSRTACSERETVREREPALSNSGYIHGQQTSAVDKEYEQKQKQKEERIPLEKDDDVSLRAPIDSTLNPSVTAELCLTNAVTAGTGAGTGAAAVAVAASLSSVSHGISWTDDESDIGTH